MSDQNYQVFNGTRGTARWDGGEAMAAVNIIDADWLMSVRGKDQPPEDAVIDLMGQRWQRGVEVTSSVRDMRTYRIKKATFLKG